MAASNCVAGMSANIYKPLLLPLFVGLLSFAQVTQAEVTADFLRQGFVANYESVKTARVVAQVKFKRSEAFLAATRKQLGIDERNDIDIPGERRVEQWSAVDGRVRREVTLPTIGGDTVPFLTVMYDGGEIAGEIKSVYQSGTELNRYGQVRMPDQLDRMLSTPDRSWDAAFYLAGAFLQADKTKAAVQVTGPMEDRSGKAGLYELRIGTKSLIVDSENGFAPVALKITNSAGQISYEGEADSVQEYDGVWLPTTWKERFYDVKTQQVNDEVETTILEAEFNIPIEPSRFAVSFPLELPVIDLRPGRGNLWYQEGLPSASDVVGMELPSNPVRGIEVPSDQLAKGAADEPGPAVTPETPEAARPAEAKSHTTKPYIVAGSIIAVLCTFIVFKRLR